MSLKFPEGESEELNTEAVLKEAEKIMGLSNLGKRPLLERLMSLKEHVAKPGIREDVLAFGLITGYAMTEPFKMVFSAPFTLVKELKQYGYSKTAKVMGTLGVAIPAIVVGSYLLKEETPEVAIVQGVAFWGVEGLASLVMQSLLLDKTRQPPQGRHL